MNKTYIFDVLRQESERSLHLTVVHCGVPTIEPYEIKSELAHHFELSPNLPPEQILFLGTTKCEQLFKVVTASDVLGLHHFTRHSSPPTLAAACLNKDGVVQMTTGDAKALSPELLNRIQHSGLRHMFIRREALLHSSDAFHYIKPSKKHCVKFIRTANVLSGGPETAFLAFCILKHAIRPDLRFIYVDTSSIAALGYVLALNRIELDASWRVPLVESFRSHWGIESAKLENVETSLFLVSASTSGDLERRLVTEKRVSPQNIITIFYLGERELESTVLCDVTLRKSRENSVNGWEEPAPSLVPDASGRCILCAAGSHTLEIFGDQFLRQEAETKSSLITTEQKPKWLDRIMEDFYGRDIVSCHRLSGIPDEGARELFVGVARAVSWRRRGGRRPTRKAQEADLLGRKTKFRAKLERLIRQVTPASLCAIVYLEDPASKALGDLVNKISDKKLRLTPARKVLREGLPERTLRDGGAIIVTCGAVVAGQRLMEVTQALRTAVDNPITYLVGLTRTRDKARLDETKRNLKPAAVGTSLFHSVEDIHIPDDPLWRGSPWDREIEILKQVRGRFYRDRRLWEIATKRMEELGRAPAYDGLRHNLFWPAISDNRELRLRPGFHLWEFKYNDQDRWPTQADVFMTVSATLHNWRGQVRPTGGELVKNVLAPRNFVRFDDGVIQASILRAVYPGELDYREHQDLEESMSAVLRLVFENYDDLRGEACVEFLLAIAERRLLLDPFVIQHRLDELQKRLGSRTLDDTGYFGLMVARFVIEKLEVEQSLQKNPPKTRRSNSSWQA